MLGDGRGEQGKKDEVRMQKDEVRGGSATVSTGGQQDAISCGVTEFKS